MDDRFTYKPHNITQAVRQFIDTQRLTGSIHELDHRLISTFNSTVKRLVNSTPLEASKPDTQSWQWTEIVAAEDYNVGILHIYNNGHIPIHDHPGSAGLLYILQGELQVKQFQVNNSSSLLTQLEHITSLDLKESESTSFGPDNGNIHSLHASNGDVYIMDILVSPYSIYERKWYLPVDAAEKDRPVFNAVSMKKKLCFN